MTCQLADPRLPLVRANSGTQLRIRHRAHREVSRRAGRTAGDPARRPAAIHASGTLLHASSTGHTCPIGARDELRSTDGTTRRSDLVKTSIKRTLSIGIASVVALGATGAQAYAGESTP